MSTALHQIRRAIALLCATALATAALVLGSAPAQAVPVSPAPTPVLTVLSGEPPVPGQNLTIVPGEWAEGITFTYEWILDGVIEKGANGPVWTLRQQDIDVVFQGAVTASKEGFDPVRVVSDPVTIQGLQQELRPEVTVSGAPRYGATLTAVSGTWDAGVTLAHQWLRAGEPIAEATGPSYGATLGDLGSALSVRVTATKPGYSRVVTTSAATAPVAKATFSAAKATVSGVLRVGKSLKAVVKGAGGARLAHAWKAGSKKVGSKAALRLTKAMAGKRITLAVTASAPGYVTRVLTVRPSGVVKK